MLHRLPKSPNQVLITRLSAIGDCVCTVPLAAKIKQLWPDCQITWAVDCAASQLLEAHPAVDQVVKIPRKWLQHPRQWLRIREELRSIRFDLAFDPQGLSKSALLCWLSGAKYRVGFDYSQAREIAPWCYSKRVPRTCRHRVDTYMELLTPWEKINAGSAVFNMPEYPRDRESWADKLGLLEVNEGRWVAINAGAGWPSKLWPTERFGQLAEKLQSQLGLESLVFWAGEAEHKAAVEIVHSSDGAARLAPPTNLRELAQAMRTSRFLVSSDTAALQMASALDTPCVGLFGPTWADEVGSYNNLHQSIQSTLTHSSSGSIRSSDASAMHAISVSEVLDACRRLENNIEVAAKHTHTARTSKKTRAA